MDGWTNTRWKSSSMNVDDLPCPMAGDTGRDSNVQILRLGPWLSVHAQLVFISSYVGLWHFSCADTWAQQRFLQHVIVPACPVCPVWLVNIYCRALGHTLAVWHPQKFQDSDSKSWSFAACCEPRRAGCTEVQADEQEGGNSHSWPEGEWKMFKEYRNENSTFGHPHAIIVH